MHMESMEMWGGKVRKLNDVLEWSDPLIEDARSYFEHVVKVNKYCLMLR